MAKSTINFDKPVPSAEDVSAELQGLLERQARLTAEMRACDDGQRVIARETAEARRNDDRSLQVDALIRGSAYEPPADARDRMAALARKRSLLAEAVEELSVLIRASREVASRQIVETFQPEQAALAREFFEHLAKAVAVHSKFGEIKQRIERAGVSAAGLHDFAKDLLGSANSRTDHASYAMRDGVRRGYIDKANVPKGYI